MTTYITLLRYTTEGMKGISPARTNESNEAIKRAGGKLVGGYETLGAYDAVIIAEYPDERAAMKANIELSKLIGVSSNTLIAIPIQDFDQEISCFL